MNWNTIVLLAKKGSEILRLKRVRNGAVAGGKGEEQLPQAGEAMLTQSEVDAWLGLALNWFDKGSYLFKCAVLLRDLSDSFDRSLIVGSLVASPLIGDAAELDHAKHNKDIIAAMLFAFAVECWLKGLLVIRVRGEDGSRTMDKLTSTMIDAKVADLTFGNDEGWTNALLKALRDPEVQASLSALDAERAQEDLRVKNEIRTNHNSHDLYKLALAVDLPRKRECRDYLDFLSAANMLGRFPAHFNVKKNIPWDDGKAGDEKEWTKLQEAILEAYDRRSELA